jgi:hypothetical protein
MTHGNRHVRTGRVWLSGLRRAGYNAHDCDLLFRIGPRANLSKRSRAIAGRLLTIPGTVPGAGPGARPEHTYDPARVGQFEIGSRLRHTFPMADGYTVRIGKPLAFQDWHVALSDPAVAMSAALEVAGLSPTYRAVRIFRDLSASDLKRLKLAPGHARKVSRKNPKRPRDFIVSRQDSK